MKVVNIQLYGKVVDSLPCGINWAALCYENEFAVQEKLKGKMLKVAPDLLLEIHTRPYYAHLMQKDVPKAVYFCNFPGGYYHNEAVLDLYDFVFFDDILGDNYSRFHANCHFLPPWMPDAFLYGSGSYGKKTDVHLVGTGANIFPAKKWERQQIQAIVMKNESLKGSWFLDNSGRVDVRQFLGICFKADSIYVSCDSPFVDLGREVGAGVFLNKSQSFEIMEPQKEKESRRDQIIERNLFRSRIEQIIAYCFPQFGEYPDEAPAEPTF